MPTAERDALEFVDTLGRRGLYPDDGWIAHYIAYARGQTDAPDTYHLAAGLAVVSAALGNSCWLELFGGRVFPATWNVLLGTSSTMRKSTSMRLGLRLLEQMEGDDDKAAPEATNNDRRGIVLPQPGSREGLEDTMLKRADGILVAYEFGELLAVLSRDYMSGTKEMLTRWFDGDSSSRATRKDQTRKVHNPAVTILGASTPAWLEDRAKEGDIRGGFLARFLWWPAREHEKNGWLGILDERPQADGERRTLINTLSRARTYRGAFAVSEPARERFHTWLRRHEEGYEGVPAELTGFHGRLPISVLKLAMCLEASTLQGQMLLTDRAMQMAITIGTWLRQKVAEIFTEDLVFTAPAAHQRQLLEAVGGNGPKSQRDLLRKLRWTLRDFDETAATLAAQGRIVRSERKSEHGGPLTVLWQAVR